MYFVVGLTLGLSISHSPIRPSTTTQPINHHGQSSGCLLRWQKDKEEVEQRKSQGQGTACSHPRSEHIRQAVQGGWLVSLDHGVGPGRQTQDQRLLGATGPPRSGGEGHDQEGGRAFQAADLHASCGCRSVASPLGLMYIKLIGRVHLHSLYCPLLLLRCPLRCRA